MNEVDFCCRFFGVCPLIPLYTDPMGVLDYGPDNTIQSASKPERIYPGGTPGRFRDSGDSRGGFDAVYAVPAA